MRLPVKLRHQSPDRRSRSTSPKAVSIKAGTPWKTLELSPFLPPTHRTGTTHRPRGRNRPPPGPRPRQAHPLPPCSSHTFLLLACHQNQNSPEHQRPGSEAREMEDDGATAGPFAGTCVHPMGERAVVERPGGGARYAGPTRRRRGNKLRLCKPRTVAGTTRTEVVSQRQR
jgi:hypothetical protein